jgi:hypothetical protein
VTTLEKLQAIDDDGEGLDEWEVGFVGDLVDSGRVRFSVDQAEKVDKIYAERVAR